jgi:DNA-directed RNA polymerase subunit RPC12/RpoP
MLPVTGTSIVKVEVTTGDDDEFLPDVGMMPMTGMTARNVEVPAVDDDFKFLPDVDRMLPVTGTSIVKVEVPAVDDDEFLPDVGMMPVTGMIALNVEVPAIDDDFKFLPDVDRMLPVTGTSTVKVEVPAVSGDEFLPDAGRITPVTGADYLDATQPGDSGTGVVESLFGATGKQDLKSMSLPLRTNSNCCHTSDRKLSLKPVVEVFRLDPAWLNYSLQTWTACNRQTHRMNNTTTGHRSEEDLQLQACTRVCSDRKPYACTYCSKTFSTFGNIRERERIHTGQKPYACKYCSKTFAKLSNMRQHESIHSV